MDERKILLREDEMPRQWYNILADIAMLRLIDNRSGNIIHEMTPITRPGEEKSKMDLFFEEQLKEIEKNEEW